MGFLDGLKALGNHTIECLNRVNTYKTFYYKYEDKKLLEMLRYGRYARPCPDAKLSESKMAIRSVLYERGYSNSYLDSIEHRGGTCFDL